MSADDKRRWIASALATSAALPDGWIDAITERKPTKIEAKTFAQFLALSDESKAGRMAIYGIARGQNNSGWTFSVGYPEAAGSELVQSSLF